MNIFIKSHYLKNASKKFVVFSFFCARFFKTVACLVSYWFAPREGASPGMF